MKELKYWIAEDGTKFEDKQKCEQYEKQMILKEHKNDFVFYNFYQKPIPIEQATPESIYYILVKTPEAAECICDWFESNDYYAPFENRNFEQAVGLWFFVECEDYDNSGCWYDIEDEIERLQSLRNKLIKEVKKNETDY